MGVWKKVVVKFGTKWGLPSLNGRHRPNFWRNPKFLRPSDRELPGDYFGLWNFLKRSFLAWVIDDQRSQNGGILPCFYTNPSLFLAFNVFTSIVYFFWSFPPLRNTTPAWPDLASFFTPTDLRLGFSRGGYKSFSLCEYCLWCQCDQPRHGYKIMGKHPGLSHVTKRRIRRREEVALKFKLIRAKYRSCIIQKVNAEKRNIKVLYPFSDRNDFFLLLTLIGDWCRTAPDIAHTAQPAPVTNYSGAWAPPPVREIRLPMLLLFYASQFLGTVPRPA